MSVKSSVSETVRIGILLAAASGLMDSYSYMTRGHVFANAQTGNMVMFGINIASGYMGNAWKYFFPVLTFIAAIYVTELIHHKISEKYILHWRQWAVLAESGILAGVVFIPYDLNLLATCMLACASGIQVDTFQRIHGNEIATTICMGNMKSGAQNLAAFLIKRKSKFLYRAFLYFGAIACIIGGATLGALVVPYLGRYTLFISVGLLLIAFFMMFIGNVRSTRLLEGEG